MARFDKLMEVWSLGCWMPWIWETSAFHPHLLKLYANYYYIVIKEHMISPDWFHALSYWDLDLSYWNVLFSSLLQCCSMLFDVCLFTELSRLLWRQNGRRRGKCTSQWGSMPSRSRYSIRSISASDFNLDYDFDISLFSPFPPLFLWISVIMRLFYVSSVLNTRNWTRNAE